MRDLKASPASAHVYDIWYADDSSAHSNLSRSGDWLVKLEELAPNHGHWLNCSKSAIATNSEEVENNAKELFSNLGVTSFIRGSRFLGSHIRNDGLDKHLISKVKNSLLV